MCGTFRSKQRQRSFDQDAFCAWLEERALAYEFGEQAVALRAAADPRKKFIKKAIAARDKQARDAAEGKPHLPKTLPEAFGLPDAEKWVESSEAEMGGLTDNNVVEHGYTLDQLKDLGVPVDPKLGRVKPIGMSVVLSHKYIDGILARYKTRFAVAGHSGNLQKGVHFDETFAASPNQHTSRILNALLVQQRWSRLSFDIAQAYSTRG